ncbi:hypothetical protein Tco_0801514 [Tanacetum coccineum]|uniref:Uncharacterized protein n=1 Tax=Tanacetum coccineum TaxID=301880 RepID=A0ABQ4ZYX5_9ASTR
MVVKNKVNTKPINYAVLNNDYNKRFVRQSDLYSEHAYWKATLVPPLDPSSSSTTNKVEVPKEFPKAVEQHRLESKTSEVKMNQVLSENERVLAQAIDHDIVKTVVNLSVNDGCETVNECQKCLELKKNSVLDQNAPSFTQLFELSELRAQSQEKDTVIVKLKEQI